jgi:hypothetical protein
MKKHLLVGITWLIMGGGGEQSQPCILGTLIYEGFRFFFFFRACQLMPQMHLSLRLIVQRSQVRKIGKIHLNADFYFCPSLHH